MKPKNYSTIRSILKQEQGEKIAPYTDTKAIQEYLDKERITYEIYQKLNISLGDNTSGRSQQELNFKKRELPETSQEPRKKRKTSEE